MDRNESANEGGSSPDTVIARSSSEEERNRFACSTSGEYVTVGDSSSSVDTVTSVGTTTDVATGDPPAADDKKKGRFGALKSSFRKEGGLFKIRRKNRQLDESAAEPELDVEEKGLSIWLVPLSLSLSLFELFAFEQDCGYGKFILVVAEVLLLFFLVLGYVLFEGLFFSASLR